MYSIDVEECRRIVENCVKSEFRKRNPNLPIPAILVQIESMRMQGVECHAHGYVKPDTVYGLRQRIDFYAQVDRKTRACVVKF